MSKLKSIYHNGEEQNLFPVGFVDHVFRDIAKGYSGKGLDKLKQLGTIWMRRTVREDMKIINFEQKEKNEDLLLPLTKKEFNWLKNQLEMPI